MGGACWLWALPRDELSEPFVRKPPELGCVLSGWHYCSYLRLGITFPRSPFPVWLAWAKRGTCVRLGKWKWSRSRYSQKSQWSETMTYRYRRIAHGIQSLIPPADPASREWPQSIKCLTTVLIEAIASTDLPWAPYSPFHLDGQTCTLSENFLYALSTPLLL